jgi:hypothetical protein
MSSTIRYACVESHDDARALREGPTVTFVEGAWAYCAHGGLRNHAWQRTPGDGLTIDEIHVSGLVRKRVLAQ